MAEGKDGPIDADSRENARVGYQAAVELWAHQDGITWSLFNAMLVGHSIIIAGIALVLTQMRELWALAVILAVVGFVISFVWTRMMARGFAYQRYWTWAAAELEEKYLAPVQTVVRGRRFAEGEKVAFGLQDREQQVHEMPGWGRSRVRRGAYAVVVSFMVIYLAGVVAAIYSALSA